MKWRNQLWTMLSLVPFSTGLSGQSNGAISIAVEPELELGASLTDATDQFGLVTRASRLSDGRILILDQLPPAVRMYGADGRFIRDIGGEGDGPGEFRIPLDFVVVDSTIVVLETTGRRTWFDLQGVVIRTDRVTLEVCGPDRQARPGGLAADGSVVIRCEDRLFGHVVGEYRRSIGLVLATPGGVETLGFFPADSGRADSGSIPIPRPYVPNAGLHWAAGRDTLFVASGSGREVLIFGLQEAGSTRLPLPVSNRRTRDSDVTASIAEGLRIVGNANDRRVVEEWFSEMPRAERTPYVRSLRAAQDGALWVETWAEGPLGSTWLRVAPGLGRVSPVRVPFTGELLDAGANWTIWRVQDEYGVDRVRLHWAN